MAAIGAQVGGEHAAVVHRGLARLRLEDERRRTVAEQHAGGPVLPVEQAREGLGADHQRALVRAGAEELVGRRDAEDEARAHCLQVEGCAADHAEAGLHLRRHRREGVVRRGGRDDEEVDVGRTEAGVAQRGLGRGERQRRRSLVAAGDVAAGDAGALHDPAVGRVDPLGQFAVADDFLRQAGADAPDDGAQAGTVGGCHVCSDLAACGAVCAAPFWLAACGATASVSPMRRSSWLRTMV